MGQKWSGHNSYCVTIMNLEGGGFGFQQAQTTAVLICLLYPSKVYHRLTSVRLETETDVSTFESGIFLRIIYRLTVGYEGSKFAPLNLNARRRQVVSIPGKCQNFDRRFEK